MSITVPDEDQARNAIVAWIAANVPAAAQGVLLLLAPVILRIVYDPNARAVAIDRLIELARLLFGSGENVYAFNDRVMPHMTDEERADLQAMRAKAAFETAVSAFDSEKVARQALISAVLTGLASLIVL